LASLRAQTFTDWVCELHNDAPEDDFPRQLLAEIRDPRITLHQHKTNWGAVATFNHAFAGGPEAFLSILEDDNWWEPHFLSTALSALRSTPEANVVWSNLHLWREEPDHTWTNTGRTIWSPRNRAPQLFYWPQPLQCFDGLHSNGAMVVRAAASRQALVPTATPFDIIEPVRERLLPGGWLLLPEPLGHFALTLATARSENRGRWMQSQLLVAASYLTAVALSPVDWAALWRHLRAQIPAGTPLLFHLAFAGIHPGAILRHAHTVEWLRFLAGVVRHPLNFLGSLRFRSVHATAWQAMLAGAKARTAGTPGQTKPPQWTKTLAP
jgi:hypothetical protein